MFGTSVPALEGPLAPTLFKIIKGSPTQEQLAAVATLLTVLAALPDARPEAPAEPGPAARWDRSEILPPASWAAVRP
ncbi:acyl-CoA carboxylase subunit epsilon [Streptomyces sp. NBC_00503]|uniref:acyl-CoA carboxylase subunit epsilon n=1 Tax=Streptomyces sp. NBC_00503 TaxID=2903659 RepID=UPI002E7FB473|nr:acyl-CoA carboxylase subunit epsilon [Streptomyces sp. NBC_00503]WUD86315.1 acyl-CoA carboxylase subunit epsilon [Streptomyces sp. NBC_00503]